MKINTAARNMMTGGRVVGVCAWMVVVSAGGVCAFGQNVGGGVVLDAMGRPLVVGGQPGAGAGGVRAGGSGRISGLREPIRPANIDLLSLAQQPRPRVARPGVGPGVGPAVAIGLASGAVGKVVAPAVPSVVVVPAGDVAVAGPVVDVVPGLGQQVDVGAMSALPVGGVVVGAVDTPLPRMLSPIAPGGGLVKEGEVDGVAGQVVTNLAEPDAGQVVAGRVAAVAVPVVAPVETPVVTPVVVTEVVGLGSSTSTAAEISAASAGLPSTLGQVELGSVVAPVVEPVVAPVVETVVAPVVTPVVETVVAPVVAPVVVPVVETVAAPAVAPVVTPVVETVAAPVVVSNGVGGGALGLPSSSPTSSAAVDLARVESLSGGSAVVPEGVIRPTPMVLVGGEVKLVEPVVAPVVAPVVETVVAPVVAPVAVPEVVKVEEPRDVVKVVEPLPAVLGGDERAVGTVVPVPPIATTPLPAATGLGSVTQADSPVVSPVVAPVVPVVAPIVAPGVATNGGSTPARQGGSETRAGANKPDALGVRVMSLTGTPGMVQWQQNDQPTWQIPELEQGATGTFVIRTGPDAGCEFVVDDGIRMRMGRLTRLDIRMSNESANRQPLVNLTRGLVYIQPGTRTVIVQTPQKRVTISGEATQVIHDNTGTRTIGFGAGGAAAAGQ